MKRIFTFLLMTVAITICLGVLFCVIVAAPESWQDTPWTLAEHSAAGLFVVLAWPVLLGGLLLTHVPLPDVLVTPYMLILFLIGGAFWTTIIQFAHNRLRRRNALNKSLQATSQ